MSTGDPEMVYTVLQHRDYHNTSMALEGVPELLHKILEVPASVCLLPGLEQSGGVTVAGNTM